MSCPTGLSENLAADKFQVIGEKSDRNSGNEGGILETCIDASPNDNGLLGKDQFEEEPGSRTCTGEWLPGTSHKHYAGRRPAGTKQPVVLAKNGPRIMQLLPSGDKREILSVGLACSECFSGPRLAQLLLPGFEYEQQAIQRLVSGSYASPLSIHTSGGVPAALDDFIQALEPHLPWKEDKEEDWCISLQLEGASAVWAAIDMLLQLQDVRGNKGRRKVAVGCRSYHGPPSTSCGSKSPLWTKEYQVLYPVPAPGDTDHQKFASEFGMFLDEHGDEIGVMLIEPQWGSSQAGFPWPKELLKTYIAMARERGIMICSDEIMCGLGRHGKGTLFLAEAWGLNVDAVTFGKAVAGGVFPLSGAVLRSGARALGRAGKTVIQSHTFAGSSVRALMTAAEVLKVLPDYFPYIAQLGEEMEHIFRYLSMKSDGFLTAHGQGLMWGCLLQRTGKHRDESARAFAMQCLKKHCEEAGVLPYFVPAGGFMVTPVMDVDVRTVYKIGEKFELAIKRTMEEVNWKGGSEVLKKQAPLVKPVRVFSDVGSCTKCILSTRSCTSCTSFVSRSIRTRFMCA